MCRLSGDSRKHRISRTTSDPALDARISGRAGSPAAAAPHAGKSLPARTLALPRRVSVTPMERARQALLLIAAILAAGYGAILLRDFVIAWYHLPGAAGVGGRRSALLSLLFGVAANRLVARRARRSSDLALALHRAHSRVFLVLIALVVAYAVVEEGLLRALGLNNSAVLNLELLVGASAVTHVRRAAAALECHPRPLCIRARSPTVEAFRLKRKPQEVIKAGRHRRPTQQVRLKPDATEGRHSRSG
jgi:hypothetical protein